MKLELLEETFTNEKSGEAVPGITIIIDGDLKRVLDTITRLDPTLKSYTGIIANALVQGINKEMVKYKSDELIIFEENLYNSQNNQKFKGVRVMITGKLRNTLDSQINSERLHSYSEAVSTDFKIGLNNIINGCKGRVVKNE